MERHQFINAEDKDIVPRFDKLAKMATTDLFKSAECPVTNSYGYFDLKSLDNAVDPVRENWLDEVHGYTGTLNVQAWLESVTTNAAWIFDATEIR